MYVIDDKPVEMSILGLGILFINRDWNMHCLKYEWFVCLLILGVTVHKQRLKCALSRMNCYDLPILGVTVYLSIN